MEESRAEEEQGQIGRRKGVHQEGRVGGTLRRWMNRRTDRNAQSSC